MPSTITCETISKTAHLSSSSDSLSHSSEHLEEQPQHRTYEIKISSKFGRHLVAAKNLRKGDEIFQEDPLVVGPALMGAIPWSCLGCNRAVYPEAADICTGCQWPVCSRKCAGLSDPDFHGPECELLKIVKQITKTCRMDLLLPLRCLILQTTNPEIWEKLDDVALKASVQNINCEPDLQTANLMNDFKRINGAVSRYIPDCSSATVRNVFTTLALCGQGLFTPYSGPLAAVYAISSFLVHSCVPNVTIIRDGTFGFETPSPAENECCGRSTVRASRDIRKGEVLTYPWVNLFCSTLDRLKELTVRNSRCSCARCADPSELGTHSGTLKCLDCSGYILPVNPEKIGSSDWVCDKGCGKKLNTLKVTRLHHGLFLLIGRVRLEQKPTTDRLELLLKTVEKYLHPRHYLSVTVKRLLAKTYGEDGLHGLTMEQLTRKSAFSKEVWTTMSDPNILPHGATNVAECMWEQCRADFELLKRKFKSKEWNSDRVVREVVHCRSLLSGIWEVCRPECFFPPRAKLVKDAAEQDIAIVAWAMAKQLKLP